MGEAFTLRPMAPADIAQVACIHEQALPDDPASLLGGDFLAGHLYPALLDSSVCALVAVPADDPGRPLGFVVCGADNPLRLVARRAPAATCSAGLRAVMRTPGIVGTAMDVMLLMARGPSQLPAHELQWIAVSQEARGRGLGSALVSALVSRLGDLRIDRVWVKTLARTPENVAFYRRNGFESTAEIRGRVFLSRAIAW